METNGLYEFGDYRLDAAERLLLCGDRPVALTPKAFDTLLVLVRHNGHLVSKDQLMKEVWSDAFVEEINVARNVWTLRKALADDERVHRYIETVPRIGYRFIAPVREVNGSGMGVPPMNHAQDAPATSARTSHGYRAWAIVVLSGVVLRLWAMEIFFSACTDARPISETKPETSTGTKPVPARRIVRKTTRPLNS